LLSREGAIERIDGIRTVLRSQSKSGSQFGSSGKWDVKEKREALQIAQTKDKRET